VRFTPQFLIHDFHPATPSPTSEFHFRALIPIRFNTILDINSPNEDTIPTIADNHLNLVLLSIKDRTLGLQNLKKTLAVIAAMEQKAGYLQRNVLVPLGIYKSIAEVLTLQCG